MGKYKKLYGTLLLGPVSYTHLDVYKRQIHYLLQIACLQTGIGIEFLGIKPGTGAELQCFLPEIRLYEMCIRDRSHLQ